MINISNEKKIKKCTIIIFLLLVLTITTLVIALLINYPFLTEAKFFLTLFILIFLLLLCKLKCFILEYSGEVITIKEFYPFPPKKLIFPSVEFPAKYIKKCTLENKRYGYIVLITFNLENVKRSTFKFKIIGLSNKDKKKLWSLFMT